MSRKVIRNSLISIFVGILISIVSWYLPAGNEPVNYAGGMCIFGGLVFLDQAVMLKVFGKKKPSGSSLLRLPVYILAAVILLMLPRIIEFENMLQPIFRAFGIALFLLGAWRFFTYTTIEEQDMQKKDGEEHEV
ncbi:MAG: hypothetical protein ACI39H_04555 [Lachnospiraceae bacterium]